MAQKQFKIGLSNTDKQNMAQDVYERVLALTFNEYDTATEYEVGDFVVYNNQLYKCIGDTSGAWDSSKWQLATLNDLLTDIESAVAFVNDKANVDGNYPTMTVGAADNLTPYDEESGIKQSAPFNFQASGTNNGADPTATVGELALLQEKRGNTVVVNQGVQAPSFNSSVAPDYTLVKSSAFYPNGHKILVLGNIKTNKFTFHCNIFNGTENVDGYDFINGAGNFAHVFNNNFGASIQFNFYAVNVTETANYEGEVYSVDLTQWFNGDIPQDLLDHPENFFRYYQGSLAYNEGTLVNANGRYLKTVGRNQWDEEWEVVSDHIESKNYCKCIPNTQYHYYNGSGIGLGNGLNWYDKDKNLIKTDYIESGNTPTSPANACFFKFGVGAAYGTTYNHDITISIYYEGESGYDQYYPYEELANIDTGTEVLRSAGSVKDSKAPDGTITRRVGVVDLGTLNWSRQTYPDPGIPLFEADIPIRKNGSVSLTCSKYVSVNGPRTLLANIDKAISSFNATDSSGICIRDDSYTDAAAFKTSLSGVYLFYELNEPTTEQGTPYSENVAIDDFGSMSFEGTNGVPQGALIFYPVDYKAYLDTLHKYTDGDPDNLALNSELNAKFENYLKSLSGYNASETQVLKNISGTLTWVTEGE